jgi:hypothetical protein
MENEAYTSVDFTPVMSYIDKKFVDTNAHLAETIDLNLANLGKIWSIKETATPAVETAKLNESMTATVKKSTSMLIPILEGSALAIFATELTDGFLVKQDVKIQGVVKLAEAFVVYKWGKIIPGLGETGKNVFAVLLAFDALRTIVPFDVWIKENLVAKIVPPAAAGLGRNPPLNSVNRQADQVASDYSNIFGGRR